MNDDNDEFANWWRAPEQEELRKSCAMGWGRYIWQACRAALKVELPDVPDFVISAEESLDMEPEVYESLESIHCAEVAMLHRCKRALQQAGIEVSP